MLIDWWDIITSALLDLWQGFVDFIPRFIGALVIFLIGWAIAAGVGKLVAEILRRLQLNRLFEKGSMKNALEKANVKVDASGFIGAIIKWILVIVFLLAAVETLGLFQFASFLTDVLDYLPNVVVAVLIFVVTIIISDIAEKVVKTAVEGAKLGYGEAAGAIVRWSIWVFGILTILYQLGVAPELIQTLFSGIIALIVIAGGLAFGLGGKDMAADILQKIRKKMSE